MTTVEPNGNIDVLKLNEQSGKDWLKDLLHNGNVEVTFNKINGDKRVMTCTLKEDVIPVPVASDKEINRNRAPNENICVVWDINAKGWRSFRWDKVTEVLHD